MPTPTVQAVHLNPRHTFSKLPQPRIHLLAGQGVEGDAHCGSTVQHVYLRRRNPAAPNRTQVHLLASELLLDDLAPFHLEPGELGENITTRHLDLLHLPLATRLHLGPTAVLELTGLRTPCVQMNRLRTGLMAAAFTPGVTNTRRPSPRAGVMAIVLTGGPVQPGDPIRLKLPPAPHLPLAPI